MPKGTVTHATYGSYDYDLWYDTLNVTVHSLSYPYCRVYVRTPIDASGDFTVIFDTANEGALRKVGTNSTLTLSIPVSPNTTYVMNVCFYDENQYSQDWWVGSSGEITSDPMPEYIAYISNGSSWGRYRPYIYNGSSWEPYIPKIYTSGW